MKQLLTLLLICFASLVNAQYADTWANLNTLKQSGQLIPGAPYMVTDVGKIELIARNGYAFYEIPFRRTMFAMDFDYETFDFNTKILTGYDNIACIARCAGIWYILNDAGHRPVKVTQVSNNLLVHFAKTYDKIIDFQISLDETYSGCGLAMTCGASVGFASATVYFHKTVCSNGVLSKVPMTLAELSMPGSNIFISGKMCKNIQL